MTAAAVLKTLRERADAERAARAARYFQAQEGGYGEGDVFLGISVPELRRLARGLRDLPLEQTLELLRSSYHEARLLALLLLADRYRRAGPAEREEIFRSYLEHTAYVNNWDLVDQSAPRIVGPHLEEGDGSLLDRLAESSSLWERRIALLATLHFIRRGRFADTLRLAEKLLDDPEEMVQKAIGWMLREVGKRDEAALLGFLEEHAGRMPRATLRYATAKLPAALRRRFLGG
ncbi:DNA alkylation repair protein [Oceanithermus sp.]|jgi:3-methyladenine DNA glycosylase AlkD